jgi:hypothetical protein
VAKVKAALRLGGKLLLFKKQPRHQQLRRLPVITAVFSHSPFAQFHTPLYKVPKAQGGLIKVDRKSSRRTFD